MYLKKIIAKLLDFIFPIYCVACNKENTYACENCFDKIDFTGYISGFSHFESAERKKHFEEIISAGRYKEDSILAKLIHLFKYDSAKEIGILLAVPLLNLTIKNADYFRNAVLVPVPLHFRRQNRRGFNQSEILAEELSNSTKIPMQILLTRRRYTRPQVELDHKERMNNLVDAFGLKNSDEKLDPKTVYCLIDDVCTTGSTINECAKVLKKNGAERVIGLVVAQATQAK